MVSTYQIVLGTTSLEITPEEVALNASELIPKSQISGIFPMTFQERQVGDTDWTYPYDTITRITIYLKNGRKLEVELQSVTNQSGWSGGTLADLQQAIADINPWLQTSTPPIPIPDYFVNYTEILPTSQTKFAWRDGAAVEYYNGRLIMMGGWNDDNAFGAGTANTTTNEVWESYDHGYTWTKIANAPWEKRHSMGHCQKDGKIWIYGGDYFQSHYQKDVWTFDDVNGWVQVTSDWGLVAGDRMLFAWCEHKGFLYMAGGQTDYAATSVFTNIVRSSDGITWTVVGTLPISYFSTGAMVSDGANLYILGGGRYANAGSDNPNTNIYKSVNDGVSFSLTANISTQLTGPFYCNAAFMADAIYIINGGSVIGGVGANHTGMYYTYDGGITVGTVPGNQTVRHASGVCTNGTDLYLVSGNETPQVVGVNAVEPTVGIETETQDYINYLFPTATGHQYVTDVNTYILAEKTASNWTTKIASVYDLAAPYFIWTWTNMRQPTLPKNTFTGTIVYTANSGYQGNASGVIISGFNPYLHNLGILTATNLSHSVYSKTNSAGNLADAGQVNSGGGDMVFFTKWSDGKAYIGMNSVGEVTFASGFNTAAYFICTRQSTVGKMYRNGTVISSPTISSLPYANLPNYNDHVLAYWSGTVIGFRTTRKISMRIIGSGDINAVAHSAAIDAYATARGFSN